MATNTEYYTNRIGGISDSFVRSFSGEYGWLLALGAVLVLGFFLAGPWLLNQRRKKNPPRPQRRDIDDLPF